MPRQKRTVPWLGIRDGVYHVFWYDDTKRRTERFSLRTRDVDEATARYAAFLTQGKDIYAGQQRVGVRVRDCLDNYLAEHVEVNVVDKQRQRDAIANLRLFFDNMEVREIGVPECRQYTKGRESGQFSLKTKNGRARLASPGTIKRELNVLMAALNHAVKWKRLDRNDLPVLEKPKTARSKGLWLFPDELEKLRAAADQRTRDFIDICYHTAARRRSIESLTWFQVDLANGRINLAKPDDPVTKKRKPIVKIDLPLLPVLNRLSDGKTSGFVLGDDNRMYKRFRGALKRAKLLTLPARDMRPAGVASPHILRHSWATHRLNEGHSPKGVADRLGDSVTTVLRVYGHACVDYLEDAIGKGTAND